MKESLNLNKKIIIGAAAALLLLIGVAVFFLAGNNSDDKDSIDQRRQNTITLAMEYLERGDYQRALELLDSLLIDDPFDEIVRQLRDEVLLQRDLFLAAEAAAEIISAAGDRPLTPEEQAAQARLMEQRRAAQEAEAAAARAEEAMQAETETELEDELEPGDEAEAL